MCFSRSENCNKRDLGNAACYRGVNAARFSLGELDSEADRQRGERGCAHPHSGPAPGLIRPRETEKRGWGGTRVGQTFPWQDPRDTAEARVQPVKERLRARQSISVAHLHNKWSSHSFCSARSLAHMRAIRECIHSGLISTHQRRVRETGREGGEAAICWSGTLQTLTPCLYQKRQNECAVRWQNL